MQFLGPGAASSRLSLISAAALYHYLTVVVPFDVLQQLYYRAKLDLMTVRSTTSGPTLTAKQIKQRFAQFSRIYALHRPLVQRCLNIALIVYGLGSTYRGLTSRPTSSPNSKKSTKTTKDNVGAQETPTPRPPRVAVSYLECLLPPASSDSCTRSLGRRCILSTTLNNSSNYYSKCSIQGSPASAHALKLTCIQNCDLTICCCTRRKVCDRFHVSRVVLTRELQNRRQSSARATFAIFLQYSEVVAGGHTRHMDQQLAELHSKQTCHCLPHTADEGGDEAVSG